MKMTFRIDNKSIVLVDLWCVLLTFLSLNMLEIPDYVHLIIGCGVLLFVDKQLRASVLFAAMPFASTLPMRELVAIYIIYEIINNRFTLNAVSFCIVGLWCALEFVAEMLHGGTVRAAVSFSLFVIATTIMCNKSYSDGDKDFLQKSFLCGFFGATIAMVYLTAKSCSFNMIRMLKLRLGTMSGGFDFIHIGSNGLGLLCCIAISIVVMILLEKQKRILQNILLVLYFALIGLLTQSRSYLLGVTMLTVFIFVLLKKEKILRPIYLFAFVSIIVLAGYLYLKYFGSSYEQFMFRFTAYEDLTNGRSDLNSFYLHHMFDEFGGLIAGYGLDAYPAYLGATNTGHNATIEIIVSWGIIGTVVAIAWFIIVIRNQIKNMHRINTLSLMPMLIYVIMVQSTRMFRTLVPILYFALCVISLRKKNEQEGKSI